jgi:hypothetical protein
MVLGGGDNRSYHTKDRPDGRFCGVSNGGSPKNHPVRRWCVYSTDRATTSMTGGFRQWMEQLQYNMMSFTAFVKQLA